MGGVGALRGAIAYKSGLLQALAAQHPHLIGDKATAALLAATTSGGLDLAAPHHPPLKHLIGLTRHAMAAACIHAPLPAHRIRELVRPRPYPPVTATDSGSWAGTPPANWLRWLGGPGDWQGLRILYEARIAGGVLRNETDGSTDLAAWHPLDSVPSLDRVELVDIGLQLWCDRPRWVART
ncbi:hypothetical protein [Streptomyces sp. NPDC002785]|uniref:hypothetical protein n=1 Tax=Streptomyces sp. NPDC002785 TaxID=3154543 RepID=UPI003323097E